MIDGPVEILAIEDNPGDIRLIKEALKENKLNNKLTVAEDGVEAMAILHREGKYAGSKLPDIIILDLKLPRMDGLDVLEEIKADSDLKRIPVIILTSSRSEEDIMKSYNSYANCYIMKPVGLDQLINTVKSIEDFWLNTVKLPPK